MSTRGSKNQSNDVFYKKIIRMCHFFTVKELKHLLDNYSNCFPIAIKSNIIQKIIVKNHLNPDKVSYLKTLQELLYKCNVPQDQCITFIQNLSFQDIILHKKKIWKTVELIEVANVDKTKQTIDQLKATILKTLRIQKQQLAVITILTEDEIHWCMLICMKYNRNGVPKYDSPIFFTFDEQRTSLCLLTTKFSFIIDILVESFGYSNFKECDLKGKDVKTLHNLISCQKRRPAVQNSPTVSSTTRSTHTSKRPYFESDCHLQEISIECQVNWKGLQVKKRKKLETVHTVCKLQAPDVNAFIDDLKRSGVIKPPYPPWTLQLNSTKSNTIHVEE